MPLRDSMFNLSGTFERKLFGHVLEIVPMAESIEKLTAVCPFCGSDASFSKLICKPNPDSSILVGGAEKYVAVCRQCYFTK